MDPSKVIICKCENVTLKDLIDAIEMGIDDLEVLKRYLRIGMGQCQGLYCIPLVIRELARRTGRDVNSIKIPVNRPPITPIPLKYFIKQGGGSVES